MILNIRWTLIKLLDYLIGLLLPRSKSTLMDVRIKKKALELLMYEKASSMPLMDFRMRLDYWAKLDYIVNRKIYRTYDVKEL